MDTHQGDIRSSLRGLADRQRESLDGHPGPEILLAYHEGELDPGEAERVQDHLALCPDCTRVILEMAELAGVEPSLEGQLSGEEMARLWPTVQSRLSAERPAAPRWPLALAAALLLAVVGLSVWALSLREANRRLSQPRVNVTLQDLVPLAEERLREGAGTETPRLRQGGSAVLVLNLADLRPFSRYRIDIVGPDGRVLWSSEEPARSSRGNFTVELQPGFLPAGRYRVHLLGLEDGREELLAEYRLEIAGR